MNALQYDEKKPRRLDALTSLRFFAAMAIVIHHSNGIFWNAKALGALDAGVSFFFVLSGFILTYIYHDMQKSKIDILLFYGSRIARVFPLHWVCLLLTILLLPNTVNFNFGTFLANALLIQAWIPFDQYFFSYNSVSWSISTELFFYLMFPFIVSSKEKRLQWMPVISLLAVIVFVTISYYADLSPWDPAQNDISSTGLLYVNPLTRAFEFVLGIISGTIFLRTGHPSPPNSHTDTNVTETHHKEYSLNWTIAEATTIVIFLLGICYYLSALEVIRHWITFASEGGHVPFLAKLIDADTIEDISNAVEIFLSEWANHVGLSPLAGLLIYVVAHQKGAISHALSKKWLVFLGEISFGLYLIHQILIRFFERHILTISTIPRMALFGLFIVVIFLTASALYLFIEKPSRAFLTNRFRSKFRVLST